MLKSVTKYLKFLPALKCKIFKFFHCNSNARCLKFLTASHILLFLQVIFSVFRLGFFMRVFSRPLQRGFVFGGVLVLLPSQIKVLVGVIVPNFSGTFGFFKVLLLVFSPQHRLASILFSKPLLNV